MSWFGDLFGGKQGTSTNNYFDDPNMRNNANWNIDNMMRIMGDRSADPGAELGRVTSDVQNNAILGQIFGKGGTLQNTAQEEAQLANRGFSLQPEDYEAYGQGMGQIARNFDTAQGSLAQAMANRGLSNSGVAGKNFMTSQGSKLEQLGQLQTQIAQQRMNMNLQRLGQTRQFLGQLGQQADTAINSQENQRRADTESAYNMGMGYLSGNQQQANNVWAQQQATQRPGLFSNLQSTLANAPLAAVGGASGFLGSIAGGPQGAQGASSGAIAGARGGQPNLGVNTSFGTPMNRPY